MNKKNTPYFLGLIFCLLTMFMNIIDMISNSVFSIVTMVSLFSVLFSFFYCFKPKKIYIIVSYILNIGFYVLSIYNYRNTIVESGWYMYQAEIDELYLQNMISTFIFFILPTILFLLGIFIEKKSYRVLATIIFILIFGAHTVLSISNLYKFGSRTLIFSTVNTIMTYLYMIIVWYKVGLCKTVSRNSIETVDKVILEKEIISVEFSLESLKNAYKNGEISKEEYNIKKSEIINSL